MKKRAGNPFLFIIPIGVGMVLFAAIIMFWHPATQKLSPSSTKTYANLISSTNTVIQSPNKSPTSFQTPTVVYHSITWKELVRFLSDDHTNWNTYDPNNYVCLDFAIDLVEAAGKKNIKAWIVGVEFTDGSPGHAFVTFQTTDRGKVYIEPQGDNTYSLLEIGKPLCDDWGIYGCWGTIASIEYLQCEHTHYCTPYMP